MDTQTPPTRTVQGGCDNYWECSESIVLQEMDARTKAVLQEDLWVKDQVSQRPPQALQTAPTRTTARGLRALRGACGVQGLLSMTEEEINLLAAKATIALLCTPPRSTHSSPCGVV